MNLDTRERSLNAERAYAQHLLGGFGFRLDFQGNLPIPNSLLDGLEEV